MKRKLQRGEELERLRVRYGGRGKEGKGRLLDEFCDQYGYERKYATRLLGKGTTGPAVVVRRPGPRARYEAGREVVEVIWRAAEQVCGKRLAQTLPLWLPHYERHYGRVTSRQKKLLGEISAATLDRLLRSRKAGVGRGIGATKPGTLLRQQIPIQGEVWAATWFPGGGQCGPLWTESGWRFHLELDLHRHG